MKSTLVALVAVVAFGFATVSAQANSPTVESVKEVVNSTVSTMTQQEADKKETKKE